MKPKQTITAYGTWVPGEILYSRSMRCTTSGWSSSGRVIVTRVQRHETYSDCTIIPCKTAAKKLWVRLLIRLRFYEPLPKSNTELLFILIMAAMGITGVILLIDALK